VNEVISEEGLKTLRDKIQRVDMLQCVKCHVSKAHKKHPPFDREGMLPEPKAIEKRSTSFFDAIHGRRPDPAATAGSESPDALLPDGEPIAAARSDAKQNQRERSQVLGTRLVKEEQ
jgi:hypothetical protein